MGALICKLGRAEAQEVSLVRHPNHRKRGPNNLQQHPTSQMNTISDQRTLLEKKRREKA
jgi:hypothetical protein